MADQIRVLLVDDDPLVRSGLHFLLDSTDDLLVVAEAGDGHEAVQATQDHRPDVVLMDLRMPRLDGIAATQQIRALPQPPHVVALTTWDLDDAVIRALEAGASGFLLKTAPPKDIMAAVRSVVAGDAMLSPRSTRHLLNHLGQDQHGPAHRQAQAALGALTEREIDVARAVGQGLSNAEIARQLYVSEATVKAHLSTIQTKLGVTNRVQIAVLAERAGLLAGGTQP